MDVSPKNWENINQKHIKILKAENYSQLLKNKD